MKRRIVVLGSTGSVGSQTLDVIRQFPNDFEVIALSAGNNTTKLAAQIKEFGPQYFYCRDESVRDLEGARRASSIDLAALPEADFVMHAMSGVDGLQATVAALEAGKRLGLSNKESIVMAGEQLKQLESRNDAMIIPVDSEPNALWQCVVGESSKPRRYIITASGGAFRDFAAEQLERVTPEQALNHPTWSMGDKITIDSATLMNKAFEVIETTHLFGADINDVDVVIHRQSVVHSMVEMADGSIKAQLGNPDMRHPIQYALFYPERKTNSALSSLDLVATGELTFESMATGRYPCFDIAMEYAKTGGTYNAALAGADEAAVGLFQRRKIGFLEIRDEIAATLEAHKPRIDYSIDDAIKTADWAFETTLARNA